MKYFIPVNLDIDGMVTAMPPHISNFKKENLLHIIDLITSIPASNKGLVVNDGYVPINAELLQKSVRNYKAYIDYLIEAGVIETDNRYIAGSKSKGYRFTEKYSGIITAYKTDHDADTKIHQSKIGMHLSGQQRKNHSHLIKWYDGNLTIDEEFAKRYIEFDYQRKLNNPALQDWDAAAKNYKNPINQYNSAVVNIEKFLRGALFFLNIDDVGHRLHSPLTNIRSDLRNLLTYNSTQLVSIDVSNSQPYLATLLFNPSFWDLTHVLTLEDIGLEYTNIFFSYTLYNSFIMLCKNDRMCSSSDIHTYIKKVEEGIFYEYIAEHIKSEARDRKNLKALVFQVLFTDNRYIGQEEAAPKRVFKEMFPDVYKILSIIKRKNKVNLPMLLQRIESYIILQIITKRVAKEQPMLPIFTIHDSIVTVQGNESYIKKVMEEEMKKVFGFPPKLTISYWKPENLKYDEKDFRMEMRA